MSPALHQHLSVCLNMVLIKRVDNFYTSQIQWISGRCGMSSCLWFSQRLCPSQLPSHPSCLPVSSSLHSQTLWGQHLDGSKCLSRVCVVCAGRQCCTVNQKSPRSESPCWPAGRFSWHVKLASTGGAWLQGGWLIQTPTERILRGCDGAAAAATPVRTKKMWSRWFSTSFVRAQKTKGWGGFSKGGEGTGWMKECVWESTDRMNKRAED